MIPGLPRIGHTSRPQLSQVSISQTFLSDTVPFLVYTRSLASLGTVGISGRVSLFCVILSHPRLFGLLLTVQMRPSHSVRSGAVSPRLPPLTGEKFSGSLRSCGSLRPFLCCIQPDTLTDDLACRIPLVEEVIEIRLNGFRQLCIDPSGVHLHHSTSYNTKAYKTYALLCKNTHS